MYRDLTNNLIEETIAACWTWSTGTYGAPDVAAVHCFLFGKTDDYEN